MPSEAIRCHENSLLLGENSIVSLASGITNPSSAAVHYIHKKWKESNFGSQTQPVLEILQGKINSYKNAGWDLYPKYF